MEAEQMHVNFYLHSVFGYTFQDLVGKAQDHDINNTSGENCDKKSRLS